MAENEEKTYILFEQNGQMKLTIPKILAQAVGLRKSDKVKLIVDRGELVIRKA
jgi:antitoxin component of MazEF toxin-antitoxin module